MIPDAPALPQVSEDVRSFLEMLPKHIWRYDVMAQIVIHRIDASESTYLSRFTRWVSRDVTLEQLQETLADIAED